MMIGRELRDELGAPELHTVRTDDGAQLCCQSFGAGPAVVFANGIGVRYPGAARQIMALRERYRVICWDYRGIGQSFMRDARRGDVSMERHARDALAILDSLGQERAALVGWSMGVQVGLEVIRLAPERVSGFAAMMGTWGRPFRTALPGPVAGLVDRLLVGMERRPALAQRLVDLAVALPTPAFHILRAVLFVGGDVDREVFAASIRSVASVEKSLYARTLSELARHDGSAVLPDIRCPALIVCAEHDYLTPPAVARRMAESIPGAVYREIDGTHFALMEQAERINGWLLELLARAHAPAEAAA